MLDYKGGTNLIMAENIEKDLANVKGKGLWNGIIIEEKMMAGSDGALDIHIQEPSLRAPANSVMK